MDFLLSKNIYAWKPFRLVFERKLPFVGLVCVQLDTNIIQWKMDGWVQLNICLMSEVSERMASNTKWSRTIIHQTPWRTLNLLHKPVVMTLVHRDAKCYN